MSTDSTELTFVRCPSCRSLVPAVSTRCRMCGASLDASAKMEEEDEGQRKSGRVRQRTMSTKNDSGAADVRDRVRADFKGEPAEADEAAAVEGDENGADDFSEEDPLSAYLEEVDSAGASGEPAAEVKEAEAEKPSPQAAAPAPPPAPPVPPAPERVEGRRPISEMRAKPEEERFGRKAERPIPPPMESPPRPAERPEAPRVVVESGGRQRGKGGILSFSKGKEAAEPEAAAEPRPEPMAPPPPPPPMPAPEPEARAEEREEPAPRVEPKPVLKPATAPRPTPPPSKQPKLRGRLFGWLVSYSDPEGSAMELREGKFFVSRSSLKPTDLLIDHESVSTPHALAVVDAENGLRIQDLMSERGIFIRKRGADAYRREEDLMVVENGDWIRLGDVELLVSLVPYVGVA